MTPWQPPSFEEWTMNAEIGGYQPDPGGGEPGYEPFVEALGHELALGGQVPAPVDSSPPAFND